MEINYDIYTYSEGIHEMEITEYSIWIVLQGSADVRSDTYQISLRPHDVLEVPMNRKVQLSVFNGKIVLGIAYLKDMNITNFSFRHHDAQYTEFMRNTFLYAIDAANLHNPRINVIMSYVDQLFFEALIGLGNSHDAAPPHIMHVMEAIVQNAGNSTFQLNAVIAETGYSASHFRKMFREEIGESPLNFLNQVRLDHAKEYIRQKNGVVSVKDVSAYCGFSDVYYFSRLFRKKEGISPSEYAKKVKENRQQGGYL